LIVDSSAIVAIILREPGHESLEERLAEALRAGIGAPTLVEAGIVLEARLGVRGRTLLAGFLGHGGIVTLPFGEEHARIAVDAFARYGRGRHPARLNYGDCMSYATASVEGEPLLCLGAEFAETDLELVS
jgi:ribonuclease VapC